MMTIYAARRLFLLVVLGLLPSSAALAAQNSSARAGSQGAHLQFVVLLSRHGVRSFIGRPDPYAKYAAAPWPHWNVPPGYLTAHGFRLMKLFGAWDRIQLSDEGLFAPSGCAGAARVAILADSDQRTRLTGQALAQGMFPGCTIAVHALPQGAHDPLFDPLGAGAVRPDYALAAASIAGRIGGNPNNLTAAYRPQLEALDHVLAGCGRTRSANQKRLSILSIPAAIHPGSGAYPVDLRGPVSAASTIVEDMLLEYTQGMNAADTGWGCVNGATLRYLMQLDTAFWRYRYRTPAIARMYASNLLDHILLAMEQSVAGKAVAGAPGRPGDRLLILSGHDTNIATVSGSLGLDWIVDGRVNDTAPGGALIFELWRSSRGEHFVRVYYTAQTLEQMRQAQTLTPAHPPLRLPIFVPGCSGQDMSCPWQSFAAVVRRAINPAYVSAKP
jgi:4-phytase/acid phosphatase